MKFKISVLAEDLFTYYLFIAFITLLGKITGNREDNREC